MIHMPASQLTKFVCLEQDRAALPRLLKVLLADRAGAVVRCEVDGRQRQARQGNVGKFGQVADNLDTVEFGLR
jgi:hypothetical protein